ncbi:hypothetical protein DITRI_Ditri02bG0158700 [Diplodiscus trichospermus]
MSKSAPSRPVVIPTLRWLFLQQGTTSVQVYRGLGGEGEEDGFGTRDVKLVEGLKMAKSMGGFGMMLSAEGDGENRDDEVEGQGDFRLCLWSL